MQLKATVGSATEKKTGVWMQAGCRSVPIDELLLFLSGFLVFATGRALFEPAFGRFQLQVFCIKNLFLHALSFICSGCTRLATYRTITVSKIELDITKRHISNLLSSSTDLCMSHPFVPQVHNTHQELM